MFGLFKSRKKEDGPRFRYSAEYGKKPKPKPVLPKETDKPHRMTSVAYRRDDLRKPSKLDQHNGQARRAFDKESRPYVTSGTAKTGYRRRTEAEIRHIARHNEMVARQNPKPVLRPRGPSADAVDAQVFEASWDNECRAARKHAFKENRRHGQAHPRHQDRSSSSLKKEFNHER